MKKLLLFTLITLFTLASCDEEVLSEIPGVGAVETARVTRVIDGDTIDVRLNSGRTERVRYIGVNTPENDETCYYEATAANAELVEGQEVNLFSDSSNTDQYGRLLRYVYVGEVFVNGVLVEEGWAESVRYEPDVQHYHAFRQWEEEAAAAGRGCHPSGIFDDGSYVR